jgi:hypothetical protein
MTTKFHAILQAIDRLFETFFVCILVAELMIVVKMSDQIFKMFDKLFATTCNFFLKTDCILPVHGTMEKYGFFTKQLFDKSKSTSYELPFLYS